MKDKKKDEPASVLRAAMLQPTPATDEPRGFPAWASVMLLIVGGAVLVFGLVRLIRWAWYF